MQQINLYTPQKKKTSFEFNAQQMGVIILAGLLGMAAISGYQYYQLRQLRAEATKLFDKKNDATAALAETKSKQIPPAVDKDLESLLQAHQRLLTGKQALVQLITELPSGATAGFSHYLEALGQQYVKGLWLNRFEFKEGGRIVNLYGNTQAAELVPDYLKKLSVEPAFQGKMFSGLRLERQENSKLADFSITTKPLSEKEEQAR